MQLARMDDVAGIRLIFKDVQSLRYFRIAFSKLNIITKRRVVMISMII